MQLHKDPNLGHHEDGHVELRDSRSIESSPRYSEDLAPASIAHRDWSACNYATHMPDQTNGAPFEGRSNRNEKGTAMVQGGLADLRKTRIAL
jgi:hypothetical protein